MGENKQRRIFRGYYKSFDGAVVHVLLIVKDIDTGEPIVLFVYDNWDNRHDHDNHSMTVQSFCQSVEYHGKTVPKFTRMTQHPAEWNDDTYMDVQGFNVPRKHIKKSRKNGIRICRSASSYEAYAKDICEYFKEDLRRFDLSTKQKKYIGIMGKTEYLWLKEDLGFINDALNTFLSDYKDIFKLHYLDGKSIRKIAEEKAINRGSVNYSLQKLRHILADQLEQRDLKTRTCRLEMSRIIASGKPDTKWNTSPDTAV